MLRWFVRLAALLLFLPSPALAAWHEARTRHFIIYADKKPAALAAFATKLEKFDRAVRQVRVMSDPAVGDGNRLTIFVLSNDNAVRKLIGDKSGRLAGYYIGRASGPVAFVPGRTDGAGDDEALQADTVFFHEYAHHLMMQALDKPLPKWLVEGFAEFLSTARFPKDGSVVLGAPAMHRSWALYNREGGLSLESLLASDHKIKTDEQEESLYAFGWLLVHYLTFDPARQGQLARYVDAIARGTSPSAAAQATFGDVKRLNRDVTSYLNRATIKAHVIPPEQLRTSSPEVRPLSPGASAVVMLHAQSRSGVDEKNAESLAAQIRAVAGRFPGDPMVEAALAEAEIDAGHADAAEAAAARALAADPRNTGAMVLKGRALVARAGSAGADSDALFNSARAIFIAANKVDTEDPEPLMEYYNSFGEQGERPTPNAVAALHYASNLAPQDLGLRLSSAWRYIVDGKLAEARQALIPIAYDPHGENLAELARRMLVKLDAGDAKGALAAASSDSKTSQ